MCPKNRTVKPPESDSLSPWGSFDRKLRTTALSFSILLWKRKREGGSSSIASITRLEVVKGSASLLSLADRVSICMLSAVTCYSESFQNPFQKLSGIYQNYDCSFIQLPNALPELLFGCSVKSILSTSAFQFHSVNDPQL